MDMVAVVVSAVVAFIVGMLWYGPLFGKQWMKMMGLTKKDMEKAKKKGMMGSMLAMLVGLLLMSYVAAWVVDATNATDYVSGALVGIMLWLGLVAPVMLGGVLWEGKSVNLYLLNVFHYFVVLVLIGVINAVWSVSL